MKKFLLIMALLASVVVQAQIGKTFWFAAPEVTDQHDASRLAQEIRISTFDSAATVRIYQPANTTTGIDVTINIPANSSQVVSTTAFQEQIETKPFDQVVNTGILIESTVNVTSYYEVATPNNTDIFALKSFNALGTEFYVPLQTTYPNNTWASQPKAYSQFNIVATEDGTDVWIFPKIAIFNHAAGVPYKITLNKGQTYSGRATGEAANLHPNGTVISSNKPIAVTYADDSVRPTSCYDLLGDQLVPTNIIGKEYVVNSNKANLNSGVEELVVIVATQNFTTIEVNGVEDRVLFAGQSHTYLNSATTYYKADKPIYLIQVTGFGCELGSAILPPLNCAGSDQVGFGRSATTSHSLFLSVLVRAGAEDGFTLDGNATLIQASDFAAVPGTGGQWMAMFKSFTTAQVSAGAAHRVRNSKDVFSLGVVNGNTSGGTRFGYFSLFQSDILVKAGADQFVCSGNKVNLAGSVSGGAVTGKWNVLNGNGTFDDDTDLSTTYNPTPTDYATGNLTFVLESTGQCFAEYDTMIVNFTPGPTIDAGVNQTVCANNANVPLTAVYNGVVSGVQWSVVPANPGGFSPGSTSNPVTYTPTTAQKTAGTFKVYATTVGVGTCQPVVDSMEVTVVASPIVNAGTDLTRCANNADATLGGSITTYLGVGQGLWSGGGNSISPSDNALTGTYTPTATEITNGSVTLNLASINNGLCNAANDNVKITYTTAPTVNAGPDQTKCANNAVLTLAGSFTAPATQAVWVGGAGTFVPNRNAMNAVYTPTAGEISLGTLTLTLQSSAGNGTCIPATDQVAFTFTPAPTIDAGIDKTVCANNDLASFTAVFTTAAGVQWTGGTGTYVSGSTSNPLSYRPSNAEKTAGTAKLYATTTGIGNCTAVVDSVFLTIQAAPIVNAGANISRCKNNADATLSGSVVTFSGAGQGVWTGGGSTVAPTDNALSGTYTPTVTELTNGSVTLTLTSINNGLCNAVSDVMVINYTPAPTVNAGPDQTICANNSAVTLAGSFTAPATQATWIGGAGTFAPNRTTPNAVYTPTAGEISGGSVTLSLQTSLGNGNCTPVIDQMTINFTPAPTVDAGINQTVCANNDAATFTAVRTVATGIQWTGGAGTYVSGSTSNPLTYRPSNAEKAAGTARLYATTTGIGNCTAVVDSVFLTIQSSPVVNAGANLSVCKNNTDAVLGGSVVTFSGAGQGVWTGGGSTVAPTDNALSGTYTPTATELTNGSVTLTLTSINNGLCNAVSDVMTITYTPAPTVNAGPDQTICANNSAVTLAGSFTAPATQATWIGGAGTFNPNRTTPNAVYTPTAGEISAGSVTLSLQTSLGNGNCTPVVDQMTINFTPAPTVDAGINQTVCANNDAATFTAVRTVATGIQWTGGAGTYVSGSTSNPLTYRPSNAEKTAGTARLYATTTGIGNCTAVVDSVFLTIQSSPVVNAGANLSVCKNNTDAVLGGSVVTFSGAGQGVWTGGGSTVAPTDNALSGTYTPTATELTNGSVTLTLTSINNGLCNAVSDVMTITYTPAPTVNAGPDQTICANNSAVTLAGSFTAPATQVTWVGGAGTFNPNRTTANAVYTPTAGEISIGSVTLTLQTSAGIGNCTAVSDQMTINFTPAPTIDAGAAQTVCANNDLASFTAVFTTAAGVQWTGGTGTYVSGATSNPLSYRPSNAEKTAGTAKLFATTTGVGNCTAVTDSVILTIQAAPIVNAGTDISRCKNNMDATLGGSVVTFSGAGQGVWTGGGSTVSPTDNALSGTYTPTATELANGFVILTLTSINNGLCNAVSDNVRITYTTAPTVSAGVDQTICSNNAATTLAGSFTAPATQGLWVGGAGTFNPNRNATNAVYTPTSGEILSGSLNLSFRTSAGLGTCLAETDQMTITFTPTPLVDAGANQTVCANNSVTTLTSVFSNASGVQWSGGTGNYVTGSTSNPLTYDPSNAEKTAGTAKLFATTTGVGNCTAVVDSVIVTIVPAPIVDAGAALTTCANNPVAALSGSVTTYSGFGQGIWSGGLGSVSPASDALAGNYTPTNPEIASGTVVLTLTSTNNGLCTAVSDNVILTITPSPNVNAGTDQSVCANNNTVSLTGSTSSGTGQWLGGSGIFTPDRNTLNATYEPTPSEVSLGTLTLTLQTSNNGLCNPVSDDMILTFTPSPTIDAGANATVCANNNLTSLTATRTVATGVQWTGGAGSFTPNAFVNNPTYQPSAAEIAAGSVKLFATTTGVGNCIAVSDSMMLSIAASPIVNAGGAIESCQNKPDAQLVGSVTPYTGLGQGAWSGGAGFVTPSNNALTGIYTPTPTEITNGTVNLLLTSTNNGICNAVNDNVTLTIVPSPTVNAGVDQFVCGNNAVISLNGSVTNAGGARWLGGLGTYAPNRTTLNAVYTPTQDEINLGSITLTLESTTNGSCNAVQDQVTITFTSSPTVDAGLNQTVCANNPNVQLAGTFSIATGAQWNGFAGTLVSGSTTDMNAVYRPSNAEIAAGTAKIYLSSTGNGLCNTVTDSMLITISPSPTVDAGSDITVCANKSTAQLAGAFTLAGGVEWIGGTGSYTPSNQVVDAQYFPSTAEIAAGFASLTLRTTANGNCNAVTDNVLINITPKPTINAGVDQSICENNPNISLGATVGLATGVQWSGGFGTYNPGSALRNTVYTATPTEVSSGSLQLIATSTGNGNCSAVKDTISITFTPAPIVDAGNPVTVCANKSNVFLNGQVLGASGGRWKNFGGSFNPNNTTLNATYLPNATEIAAGRVVLYLESTGNGNCSPVSDSVEVTITPAPTVDAGAGLTSCANNSTVQLAGTFANATGVTWSGGAGSYNASITDKAAQYTPTPTEIANGGVTLTLTTTGNGTCFAVSDNVVISISNAPTISAGADQVKCANNSKIQLTGDYTLATGGVWSGGLGLFTPNATAKNAVYTPTNTELNAGLVTLTYTTTGNGSCNAASDDMTVVFTSSPTVEAGLSKVACANNPNIILDGSFTVASGVQWFGHSGSFNPSATDPKATYTPSATEIANGLVTLKLRTTGNGLCLEALDSVTINISPAPVVSAGADKYNCVDDLDVPMAGFVSGGSSTGLWTTNGTGFFTPNASTLNAVYKMSAQDSSAGTVRLTLTSTNNGDCIAVTDQMDVFLTTPGVANAGADKSVCANNATTSLNGTVTGGAIGGTWTTNGSGTFLPDEFTLTAAYVPSAADTANGSVTLSLTANSCDNNTDDLVLTITDAPKVDAGLDQTICSNQLANLVGKVTGAGSSGIWSTQGSGSFLPDATTLNAQYQSSNADRNAGKVKLVLLSSNVGNCLPALDTVEITIKPAGIVNAGPNATICANNSDLTLSGTVSGGASTGRWTSNGTGSFVPSDTTLNATYKPSAADKTNGSVQLKLTSNSCDNAADSLVVTITPAPTVDAGTDQAVCANNSDVALTGQVTVVPNGIWSSSGTGVFVPNVFALNPTYKPSATDQNVTLTFTSIGNGNCTAVADSLVVTVTPSPLVNAGVDQVLCDGIKRVKLKGTVSGGTTTGEWKTLGSGGFDPGSVLLETDYLLSATDSANRGVTLILESTSNGNCNKEMDTLFVTITDAGTSDAGADLTVCANDPIVQLAGVIQGGATSGYWTTTGTGTFSPDSSVMNAKYTPSSLDSLNGTVTLSLVSNSCDGAKDDKVITITPAPFVNAGPDQVTCVDDLNVQLDGIIAGASTSGRWTSSGTGVFVPNNQTLNATYQASKNDSISGLVTLTLTPTNIGNCLAVSDAVELRITTGGTANAGPDQIVCSNTSGIQLAGSFGGGASQGTWTTSGTGIFTPNATTANAVYSPSTQDKVDGLITVTYTTNSCDKAKDEMVITITPAPTVNAGNNLILCSNNTDASLLGSVSGASGAVWTTTGSGAFTPSNSSLSATYKPSAVDIASGSVLLYLTSVGNGNCAFVRDSIVLTFTASPQPDAGVDQTVCNTSDRVNLRGAVTGPTVTGQWSTLGDGFFVTDPNLLDAEYVFSQNDTAKGFVRFILTSTNNGTCLAEDDTITISMGGTTFAGAGQDLFVCNENLVAQLNGFISGGATSGTWSTNGDGTFTPSVDALNATYRFGSADSVNRSVQLVLTANAGGGCSPGKDTLTVKVSEVPSVDAGNDIVICAGKDTVIFTGTSLNAVSHKWVTTGSGTFAQANDTALTGRYLLGPSDKVTGKVSLILSGASIAGCAAEADTVNISIGNPLAMDYAIRNLCVGDETEFADSTKIEFGTITSWLWRFGDGTISDVQFPKHVYTTPALYDVTLEVSTNQGCVDSLKRSITIRNSPVAEFELDVQDVSKTKVGDEISFVDQSTAAAAWTWVFGNNLDTSYDQNPVYIYTNPGDYDVDLMVVSQYGCVDTVTKTISILTDAILPPNVPNAFTPNGDGNNDVYYVRGGPFESIDFKIYNEWGNVVFETTDPLIGWDGKKNGDYQPAGIYTFTLKATTINGKSYKKSGDVTLMR